MSTSVLPQPGPPLQGLPQPGLPPHDPRRHDLQVVVALLLVGLLPPLYLRSAFDLQGLAVGSDPPLWVLTTLNMVDGSGTGVPPLFPLIASYFVRFFDITAISANGVVSLLTHVFLLPSVYLLGRRLGATILAAVLATAPLAVHPEITWYAVEIQPDSLTTLALVGTSHLLLSYLASPGRWIGPLVATTGLWPLLREHGIPLALALVGVAALPEATPRTRAIRAGAAALAILLAPILAGVTPGLPSGMPWMERLNMATSGTENIVIRPSSIEADTAHQAAHTNGDHLGVLYHHFRMALFNSPHGALLLFGSLASVFVFPDWRRRAAVLPVCPSLAAFLILSQTRHIDVATPVALGVLAATLSKKGEAIIGVVAFVLSWWLLKRWGPFEELTNKNLNRIRLDKQAGDALCAMVRPGDLWGGTPINALAYCPLKGTSLFNAGADLGWKAFYISKDPLPPPWDSVLVAPEGLEIWRAVPDLEKRPCARSFAAEGTPYFTGSTPPVATLSPPCMDAPPLRGGSFL